jgi:protein-disulfide isomerase
VPIWNRRCGRTEGDPGVNRRYIIGAIVLAVVVVLVLVGVSALGGDSKSVSSIENVDQVQKEFAEIPSSGNTIGKADAPVEIIEYGDTSCPVCKDASQTSIPQVVDEYVRSGKAKLTFRPIAFISRSS